MLKQIVVAELQPDETVDAVREARLLAKVILNPHTRTKAVWVVIVLQTGSVTLFCGMEPLHTPKLAVQHSNKTDQGRFLFGSCCWLVLCM